MKANWKKRAQEHGVVDSKEYAILKASGKGQEVFCDSCHRDFVPKPVDSVIAGVADHRLRNFVCPHCGKMYIVCIENSDTRRQHKAVKSAEQELARLKRSVPDRKVKGAFQQWSYKVLEAQGKYENEKRRLKQIYDSLEERFRGTFTGV